MRFAINGSFFTAAFSIISALIFSACNTELSPAPSAKEYRAQDFLLPSRLGVQTTFRIMHIIADSNGVRDTSFPGYVSYIVADTAYKFTPRIKAILLLVRESDTNGVKFADDSLFVFSGGGEIRLSTYYTDSVGRRLIAEPIRDGATFKRTDDSLPSSIVTIQSAQYQLATNLRIFSTVKTTRRFTSEIDNIRRELIFENYLAPGHFLVKQVSTDTETNMHTGKSYSSIIQYNLFFKNF
ncbi:hypothetical protein MASR2M18_05010 [Ignavibacteria bacterium]|nr:hypothetical protein [Bacteroidota bacterium]MCZ2133514.1 hypothetical protein [Bacteroidota bacterium]